MSVARTRYWCLRQAIRLDMPDGVRCTVDWPAMSPRVVAGAPLLAFGLVGSPRRSGSRQDPPDGVEDEVEPKLELVGVVEAGREQLTADTREVRVRIRRYLGDHR